MKFSLVELVAYVAVACCVTRVINGSTDDDIAWTNYKVYKSSFLILNLIADLGKIKYLAAKVRKKLQSSLRRRQIGYFSQGNFPRHASKH